MRIVAINGSHRGERGYTHFLINKLFKGAREAGAICEEILLSKSKIKRCLACDHCTTEGSFLKCIYSEKDDVSSIFDTMTNADIIVYGTPIYVMGMSGLLKTFIDRIYSTGDCTDYRITKSGLFFHHINNSIYSKPFVTIVTKDNLEEETSSSVVSYFNIFSKFMDAENLGTIVRSLGALTGQGQDSEKEEKFPKILESYNAIERAGRELVMDKKIKARTIKVASQEIIPIPFFRQLKKRLFFKKKILQILKGVPH